MKSNIMPDGWVSLVAADSFDQISTLGKSIKTKDCSASGKYPVVDQGQELITGYIDDLSRVIEVKNPIVLFGDHTRAVKWIDFNFVPGADGTKLLKPKMFINNRFSYYQLKSLDIPDKGYARHFKYLKELSFVIPSLAEQQVIADKLDTILAQVESIKVRLEHIPEILKKFRQSVLAAAVTGKLTEDWRNTQVDNLTWKETTLGRVILEGPQNGLYKPSSCYGSGVRIVRIDGFYDGELLDWETLKQVEVDDSEFQKWSLQPNDILVNRVNSIEYLGKSALVRNVPEPTVFESNIMRFSLNLDIANPEFITLFLCSSIGLEQLRKNAKLAVNQASINQGDVKSCLLNLPIINEQIEIVRRVKELFAYSNLLEQQVQSASDQVNNLTQSILAKAFRGELTAEWREVNLELISGENSAEALLGKIKAERELAKPATKRGRGKA